MVRRYNGDRMEGTGNIFREVIQFFLIFFLNMELLEGLGLLRMRGFSRP
jgi:hypothetical protein